MSFTKIVSTVYGDMLVPRHDEPRGRLLRETKQADDHREIALLCDILCKRGDRAMAVAADVGANVGCFALAFAGHCREVLAFEPQRTLFHMLCGSVALNDWTNVRCHNMALGRTQSAVPIPRFDYGQPGDFGCAEVHPTRGPQVGQRPLEYDEVPLRTLDSFHLHQLDVLKVDVEGMELEVLQGAERTIRECRPAMLVEWHKSDRGELENWLWEHGYSIELRGRDLLALPR